MEPSIPDTIRFLQRVLFTGRQEDSPDRAQSLFTAPSLFLPTLYPEGLSPGALPGVCSAEAVQGFTAAPFSAFFRVFLLSLSSNYSSINQSFSLSVFYVKSQENLLGYIQLDKSHVSGTACCYVCYCVIEKKLNDYLHVFRNMVAILTHTSMRVYLS